MREKYGAAVLAIHSHRDQKENRRQEDNNSKRHEDVHDFGQYLIK